MADPWTDDLAALGEHTRSQLGSLSRPRMEPNMTLFKRRPLFAIIVTALVLAVAAPVAWAIGTKIFVTIDPDETAPEIENDVHDQLEAAGVPATVHAEKSDGKLTVSVRATGSAEADLELHVSGDGSGTVEQRALRVELAVPLDDAAQAKLQAVLASPTVNAALEGDDPGAVQKVVTDALAAAGFHAVTVAVSPGSLRIRVTAPPGP